MGQGWIRRYWAAWLRRRLPRSQSVLLDRNRVFIFPSRAGMAFLLLLLLMSLVSINYQNNLGIALTFLLLSLFVASILHTYANLAGLRLQAMQARPAFVGDVLELALKIERQQARRYENLQLFWQGDEQRQSVVLDTRDAVTLTLFLRAERRGPVQTPRLCVETRYPFGWFRAWSWLWLDWPALAYPRPIAGPAPQFGPADEREGDHYVRSGTADYYGLREYIAGDSPRLIAWKAYARGQGLQSKLFSTGRDPRRWLDWDSVEGDLEQRLGKLCYWALEYDRQGESYGLRLPGCELAPASGDQQCERVLRALALYRWEPSA